jgi:hypothetical protein
VRQNRNVRTQRERGRERGGERERERTDPEMGENPVINPEAGKIQRQSSAASTQKD